VQGEALVAAHDVGGFELSGSGGSRVKCGGVECTGGWLARAACGMCVGSHTSILP
jgi:hypothetical protein